MVVDEKSSRIWSAGIYEKVQFDADPGFGEIRLWLSFVPSSTWLYTPMEAFQKLSIVPFC